MFVNLSENLEKELIEEFGEDNFERLLESCDEFLLEEITKRCEKDDYI